MKYTAKHRYADVGPRKIRQFADLIRGRNPCSKTGVLAKGGKTRKKRKPGNKAIVRRRPAGPFQNTA